MEPKQKMELTNLLNNSLYNLEDFIDTKEMQHTCGAYLKIIKSVEYEFMKNGLALPELKIKRYNQLKDKYKSMWGKLPWE